MAKEAHPFHAITDKMKFIACFLRAGKGIGACQRFVEHLNTVVYFLFRRYQGRCDGEMRNP